MNELSPSVLLSPHSRTSLALQGLNLASVAEYNAWVTSHPSFIQGLFSVFFAW